MKINCKTKVSMFVMLCIISFILPCFAMFHRQDIVFADENTIANTLDSNIEQTVTKKRYNSCDYGIVTPNLDQGTTNICWAYATASASEISILKDRLDTNTKDTLRLSPTQIAYRTYNRDSDPLGNTVGIYANDKWNVTGNPYNTFLPLSQWCAPVAGNVPAKADAFENNLYRLLDAEKIDSNSTGTYKINQIKQAIAKYGAVTASYYNAREVEYYNTKGETRDGISHAITLIGWDDTIPANKFQPKSASVDGGWIVKNSYDSCPYFYLSYDSSIGNVCGFKYANKSEFDYNYFFDNVVDEPIRSENNSKCVSNIFMAKNGNDNHTEYVKAINVATFGDNLSCSVKVFTNLTDQNNPESGTLSASGKRILDYGGYHTIVLDNLAKIDKNSYYSVVVEVSSTIGGSAYILYSLNSSPNTQFKSASGWNKSNFAGRIKAYTVLQNVQTKTDISSVLFDPISPQLYTGQSVCPQVKLTKNFQTLVQNVDFILSYKDNLNVGIATICVTGIEKYSGILTVQFEILPIDVPTKPYDKIQFSNNAKILKDIDLPAGWQWLYPDLPIDGLSSATAIYVGANKQNYKNTTISITLQKKESENELPSAETRKDKKGLSDIEIFVVTIGSIAVFSIFLFAIKKKLFFKKK